jgi:2-dehydropantoate 2-reductase
MKLVANCTELVTSAILDMTVMEAVRVPGMRELMVEAGNEAVRTALALGHRIRPIIGMSQEDVTEPEQFAERLLEVVHDVFSIEGQKTTVLQDWHKGRRSEVHELNGLIVEEQRRLGGRAPVNEIVLDLAVRIESGELAAGPDNAVLLLDRVAAGSRTNS